MKNMTTGQRIASRRKLANLSQEDISQELGVSRQAVSKWESDGGLPDIDNLIRLSKLFGVSVGWLLGTEADPTFDPSTGLSDAQLKMVEEIILRNQPKSHRWLIAVMAVCVVALALSGLFFQGQLSRLSRDTAAAQAQITGLEQSSQDIFSQLGDVSDTLEQQAQEKALLLNCHTQATLSDDAQTVTMDFYLIPKLYQENAQAYVTVLNRENSVFETIECHPMGSWYHCRAELPVYNGYRYSFLLATDSGFQEQALEGLDYVRYFNDLHSATRYHLDPSAKIRSLWYADHREYTFTQPIGSPLIDFRTAYVGYEEVDVTLYRNGEAIHTESLREQFRAQGGAHMRFEEPFLPDIRVELPQLAVGDTLTLEITAKHFNGETLTNTLETLQVVE